jgi:hypothetical protein
MVLGRLRWGVKNRAEMVGQTSVWIKVPANHGTSAHRILSVGTFNE